MDRYSATVAIPPDGAEATVTVTGRMTIEHAAQIKEHLLQALASSPRVILDLQRVAEIDLIGLQFICALHRSATAEGKVIEVRGCHTAAVGVAKCAAGFQERARCSRELNASCVWGTKEKP